VAIYLDNNASTPIAPEVSEAMLHVLKQHFGNPASTSHSFGWFAEELVSIAREQVANLIGAEPDEIIFTSGATESNNLAIKGSESFKRILSSPCEHKSVLDPIEFLADSGVNTDMLAVDSEGHIEEKDYASKLSSGPNLVSLMLANNEIGTIHDLAPMFKQAKKAGSLTHCDATQALGKIKINASSLGADFISISAHKVYGPKGVGALYVKKDKRAFLTRPLLHGGAHEMGLRSGTLNVAGIVGFGKACEIVNQRMQEDREHIESLTSQMMVGLKSSFPNMQINGSKKSRLLGNLNVSIPGIKSDQLISALSTSVAISSSSACQSHDAQPSHVLRALGLDKERLLGAFRIGIGRYNTSNEITKALEAIVKCGQNCSNQ
jgi:cysteine desulfurase